MCSCDDQQMTALDLRRATVFGQEAQEYHRWRPSYPPEAVDWVVPTGARDVLDLGAGTGKLTALLARPGLQVQAAEPDLRMLAVLRRHLPNVKAHHAPAERLPIADDSLDAVLVADAWHWFPHTQAIAEVRRVLRTGGRLALIWNTPQLATGWTSQVASSTPTPTPAALLPRRPACPPTTSRQPSSPGTGRWTPRPSPGPWAPTRPTCEPTPSTDAVTCNTRQKS